MTAAICFVTSVCASSHIVDRGESWESIADDYGVTVSQLKEANPSIVDAFVGIELFIPVEVDDMDMERRKFMRHNPLYLEAQDLAAAGKYKQAAKTYEQLIASNHNVPLDVYYHRGIAYYNWGKMHQTMNDMAYVKRNDTYGRFPDAAEIYGKAEKIQAERDANKAAIAGAIIGVAATATASYLTMEASSDMAADGSSASATSSSSAPSYDGAGYSYGTQSVDDSDMASSSSSTRKPSRCGTCSGTGTIVKYSTSFGLAEKEYCAECGKTVMSNHYHAKCPSCKGTGYR